jgi:protein SCO1/2
MRCLTFALVVAWALAGTACAPAPSVDAPSGPGRYPIAGTVVAQPSASSVTLAHDAVANYMPAMVMDFHAGHLPLLRAGDRVRGVLVVTEQESRLTDVVVVPAVAAYASTAGAPAPLGTIVPDVALLSQSGAAVRMSDYRGRVLVVTFIYTRCPLPDYCPRLMRNFSELRRVMETRPDVSSRVQLLSVSIDPEFDTPDVLRAYGQAMIEGPSPFDGWHLATGRPEAVRAVADFVGLVYEPASGTIRHSVDTAIIGADGRLVKVFSNGTWDQEAAVAIVAREAARASTVNRH